MTSKEHAEKIASLAKLKIHTKYLAGDAEHGGRLWRKACQGHMLEESIDQMVYVLTHLEHLAQIRSLAEGIENESFDALAKQGARGIINLIDVGNLDGIPEQEKSG